MSKCKKIINQKKLVCIGAMKHLIQIIDREIESIDVGYTIDFSSATTLQSAIETKKGSALFNGVNIVRENTHIFYIRYGIAAVENNYTIAFDSRYFKVVDVEDMEEEHRFLKITTVERGLTVNEATWK